MSYYYPLESTPAKNLYLEGSWQKDTDGQAYTAGDYCGDFYVTNPNDTTAKGKMFIYKNGALLNTGGTSFEINPHDTWITNLYNDFGLHGSGSDVSYGPVVIEVDEGSVIAAGQRKRCSYVNTTSHIPTYEFLWDPFFKTICTQ